MIMIATMKTILLTVFFLAQISPTVYGKRSNECKGKKECDKCIQTFGCVWCKDKNFPLEERCFANISRSGHTLPCKDIENPQGGVKQKRVPQAGSDTSTSKNHPELTLRKGQPINISFEYTDTKNKPLDLYIVMDLSCSMKKHKEKIVNLTSKLSTRLKTLTNRLRIGFGSFVDKPLPPFGNFEKQAAPACDDKTQTNLPVEPVYGFKNHLKLTENITEFITNVNSTGISTNIDSPEGTLDGLLQSIVCKEQIGWNTQKGTRNVIVISTDGPYHIAGDGKLVGVFLPHDGNCYVSTSTGFYTKATVLDYPSISVIRQSIRRNHVFVIFAVTEDQKAIYNQLSKHLYPFAVTQGIDDQNNSITRVIEEEYMKLVSTVTLLSQHNRDYISTKFYAKCSEKEDYKAGDQCTDVSSEDKVSYMVEVELKECPSNRSLWDESEITLYPSQSGEYNMTIKLKMLCGCACEHENPTNPEKSADCSQQGFLQCGICKCDPHFGGAACNCSLDTSGGVIDKSKCVDPSTGVECNSRGKCTDCGQCACDPVNGDPNAYDGQYCECNNKDCPMANDDRGLCNEDAEDGPHGSCKCSRCICRKDFLGPRCECPKSNETCLDPKSPDKICNGLAHGECHCGKCSCVASYKGKHCEIQHAAQVEGTCKAIEEQTSNCVKCLVSQNEYGERADETKKEKCRKDCSDKKILLAFKKQIVGSLPDDESKNVCKGTQEDSNGCRIDYIIRERNIHNGSILLEVETADTIREEKCPKAPPLVEIIISVASGMVLIGVFLLLIWKVFTHIQDKREYAQFEKSINDASWDGQNPLYKSTTSQFPNPAYQETEVST